jgi:antirestriction protein ArdC
MSRTDIYQEVTDFIISKLTDQIVPWQMPWKCGTAKNLVSGKSYRGINAFLLPLYGFESPNWLSFKQVSALGGKVKKGATAAEIVFWKNVFVTKKNADEKEITESFPVIRYYQVFNCDQVENLNHKENNLHSETLKFVPIESCEKIIATMPSPPQIIHEYNKACYQPSTDKVFMPGKERFLAEEDYYSTLFHELGHATGHVSRLNRANLMELCPFGSTNYSKEELVAEMTAAFLCNKTGISNKTIDNSTAYINSWINVLRGDKRFVIQAAGQAQKAADYIQGIETKHCD